MNFTRYRVLTQVLLASEVHLDLVEMNFTRYRVLTHYPLMISVQVRRRRNELHPLQGIDTKPSAYYKIMLITM